MGLWVNERIKIWELLDSWSGQKWHREKGVNFKDRFRVKHGMTLKQVRVNKLQKMRLLRFLGAMVITLFFTFRSFTNDPYIYLVFFLILNLIIASLPAIFACLCVSTRRQSSLQRKYFIIFNSSTRSLIHPFPLVFHCPLPLPNCLVS